jgi:hypothetical protein
MRLRSLLIVWFVLALAGPAAAWHQDGHMAIARITWLQLDDKEKIQVAKILKAHPHYDLFLAAECPKGVPEIEWAFAQAAVWPDWVRFPKAPGLSAADKKAVIQKYNKPVWHYVNLPYVHPVEADQFDVAALRKEILEPELDEQGEPRHVLAALKWSMKLLRAAATPAPDRAIALCWLMHLVGDVHQPLHATGLIAKTQFAPVKFLPPHGDQGGNLLAIKVKAGDAKATKLHFYWDALLFSDEPPYPVVETKVAEFLKDPKYQRDQLPELKKTAYLDWAEESLALAKTAVYQDQGAFLKATALPEKAKLKALDGLDAPVLSAAYQKTAADVAARRMVLAGYRLADQIQLALQPVD